MAGVRGKGIPVANPFACLKTEEELAEERKARRKLEQQQNNANSTKKDDNKSRNNNKSKKAIEKERLQQLAFGFARPGSANPEPAKPVSAGKKKSGKNKNSNNHKEQDWQQWKEHDQEVVEDQFREDLEKALVESQVQIEKKKSEVKEKVVSSDSTPAPEEEGKRKKKKDKAKTMSLEEFNNPKPKVQKDEDGPKDGDSSRPPIHHRIPSAGKDSKFFNSAQHEAKQILKKDKMQEEYRKTCAVDNAVVAKLKNDIEIRDKTIKDLKSKIDRMENEMKQVKQRNKQLCVILGQGEMKDKSQVLLQVDELNNVKDELMEQVTSLTAELEKEKSKNRATKPEMDKAKAGKHGK